MQEHIFKSKHIDPIFIFDLDGTLANIDHRKHILEDTENKNRWDDFYEACDKDTPNHAICIILNMLYDTYGDILIVSGRSESVRKKTEQWLLKHTVLSEDDFKNNLVMRPLKDYRPDDELKQDFLDKMLKEDRERIIAIFDDRDKVVNMWRRNGLTCCQVAPGDF